MIISFSSRALRNLAESATLAINKLGADAALSLHAYLADLAAASSVPELPIPPIFSSTNHTFALKLADGFVARFESNHKQHRETDELTVPDWRKVNRIKLVEVVKGDE